MDNKYSLYRRIRQERTYRTLGRMSWWRVVTGVLLLISVLFISGQVSMSLASRGHYTAAQKLLVWPWWVDNYRPGLREYISAGVRYQNGDYEAACEVFDALEEESAAALRSLSALRLAGERLAAGDCDAALDAVVKVDAAALSEENRRELASLCEALALHYDGTEDQATAQKLRLLPTLPGAA